MFIQNQLSSHLPNRASHCIGAKEPFVSGSEYISYVEFAERETRREDYCPSCWKKVTKEKGMFWKGKIPIKKEKPLSVDEKALKMLREQCNAQQNEELLYLLALYLERRKQLVKRLDHKGKVTFEIPFSGETFVIAKVPLSQELAKKVLCFLNE